jgi:hypothetical protein
MAAGLMLIETSVIVRGEAVVFAERGDEGAPRGRVLARRGEEHAFDDQVAKHAEVMVRLAHAQLVAGHADHSAPIDFEPRRLAGRNALPIPQLGRPLDPQPHPSIQLAPRCRLSAHTRSASPAAAGPNRRVRETIAQGSPLKPVTLPFATH